MIHLNIGSNLESNFGTRFDNITISLNLLKDAKIKIMKISNYYETPSYPNKSLPKFLNVGVIVDFTDDYLELLKKIKLIEKKLGRIKTKKNDSRIIDIDIIDFKKKILNSSELVLPHSKCHTRNFVLYPINEIDPKWSHPIFKQNVEFLINKLSQFSRIEITRLQKNVNIQL